MDQGMSLALLCELLFPFIVLFLSLKGWFDEGTRNKIHILGKDPGPTLRNLIYAADLPRPYGGELEWNFEDEPNLDNDAKAALSGVMPKGPVVYRDGTAMKPEWLNLCDI